MSNPTISTDAKIGNLFLEFPIQPPFDVTDALDATAMTVLPFSDGLTLGWKVNPMLFVDGLGRDLALYCPTIVLTGGKNTSESDVHLYAVAAFYDENNRLLSAQTSRHLVGVGELYDIPGLVSRFPCPVQLISKASVTLFFSGIESWDAPKLHLFPIQTRKTERENKTIPIENLMFYHQIKRLVVPATGPLFTSEVLTGHNALEIQLEKTESHGNTFLSLSQRQKTSSKKREFDCLVHYALYHETGQLVHGGSCMGLANQGDFVSLSPIEPEILKETNLFLELSVWEGPVGNL
ncbi:hypothetical protein P3G55_19280 [Leptospira sp. 96542]|nr:hypothetical protein [Leptospira sp. 96542]